MSVRGEFQRLVGNCRTFLEQSSTADTVWLNALDAADLRVEDSLVEAAQVILALRSGSSTQPSPDFELPSEHEAFESLADHLTQICYAITGR